MRTHDAQQYISGLRNDVQSAIKRNAWPILYTLLAIVAGILVFLVLKKYHLTGLIRSKLLNPNREYVPEDASLENYATIYLFHVSWCPHSKKAMPEWKRFKQRMQADVERQNVVSFEEVDGDEDANTSTLKRFNVDAFPLVRMEANNKVYVFEGKITEANLNSFVEQFIHFSESKKTASPVDVDE